MRKLLRAAIVGTVAVGICGKASFAYEFLEKRDCTLDFGNKPPVHTTCVIRGGMQGGTIDVSVRTPDGKTYTLEGRIDGEEGHKYLLQKHAARKSSAEDAQDSCYARNDGRLTLCLGSKID
jgi:hypothetical protein